MQKVRQQGHTAAGRFKKAEWEEKLLDDWDEKEDNRLVDSNRIRIQLNLCQCLNVMFGRIGNRVQITDGAATVCVWMRQGLCPVIGVI